MSVKWTLFVPYLLYGLIPPVNNTMQTRGTEIVTVDTFEYTRIFVPYVRQSNRLRYRFGGWSLRNQNSFGNRVAAGLTCRTGDRMSWSRPTFSFSISSPAFSSSIDSSSLEVTSLTEFSFWSAFVFSCMLFVTGWVIVPLGKLIAMTPPWRKTEHTSRKLARR